MNQSANLEKHYANDGIVDRIHVLLAESAFGSEVIDWRELSSLDQFHSRGLEATLEIAEALGIKANESILDLGSGLGGPARAIAATTGANVVGLDLTPEYVEIATLLSQRTGLDGKTQFAQGDATHPDFADATFDHVLTQHVSMNIANKQGLFDGAFRVLKRGGHFAMYDVLRGDNEPVIYPVPWSPVPELSYLASISETLGYAAKAGFETRSQSDETEKAFVGLSKVLNAPPVNAEPSEPKPLSLPQLLGPRIRELVGNMARNAGEGRVRVVKFVFKKP